MSGRKTIKAAALVLAGATLALATPAIARTVVDYAKNSGHLRGLPARAFQHWSTVEHAWRTEPGVFQLSIGHCVAERPLVHVIDVVAG